jgi:two-component system sensor histidine kinase BaeS
MRGRFFRRIGCGFLLVVLFAFGGFTALFWLIAGASGLVDLSADMLAVVRTVAFVFVVFSLVILILGGRALRRTAMPIGDMLEASGRIAEGDYATRVNESGPPEVRGLVRAFNTMAARLQSEDEQRRALLADISHELRTPITVIQGNLEGMLDGVYPSDHGQIQSILEETHVLSHMIDDLSLLSLADSGALRLQLEPTHLGELIDDVTSSFKMQSDAAGVVLKVDVQPGLPMLEIDPTRIREVLMNLLANALRYTPSGGRIAIRASMEQGTRDQVVISVSDIGAGISAQDLPHIFDRFYKAADSPGSGLGLAIAKSLVTAHSGEISARSEVGRGTEISFRLPTSPLL